MRALLNKWEAAAPPLLNAIIISYDIRSSVTFFLRFPPFFFLFFSIVIVVTVPLPRCCCRCCRVHVIIFPSSERVERNLNARNEKKKKEREREKKTESRSADLKHRRIIASGIFLKLLLEARKYSILGTGFSAWPKWEALSIESLAGSYCWGPCATSQLEALLT